MADFQQHSIHRVISHFYSSFLPGQADEIVNCVAEDWHDHTLPADRRPGRAGLHEALRNLHYLLPDLRTEIVKTVIEGEMAAVHIAFSGTHEGDLPDAPATHRTIQFVAFDMHRVAGGKVQESWHLEDSLSLMRQLHLLPAFRH